MIETAPLLQPVLSSRTFARSCSAWPEGTGSGKTTVARAILDAVGGDRIALIEQDSYYRDIDWRNEAELLHHNFDHPAALDNELLVAHLRGAQGRAIPSRCRSTTSCATAARARTRRVEPQPVVLLEGILIFVRAAPARSAGLQDLRGHGRRPAADPPAGAGHGRARAHGAGRAAAVPGDRPPHAPGVRRALQALGRHHHPRGGREPGGAGDGGGPRASSSWRGSDAVPAYLLRVAARFEAAHHLTSYKGAPEPSHGHSWRVEAALAAPELDAEGMAFDFVEVQAALRELAAAARPRRRQHRPAVRPAEPHDRADRGLVLRRAGASACRPRRSPR